MADKVVQEIKDKLDIAEIIGSYIQLRRAGANWKANCPFHGEKTPSFNVNTARQIWHCFGCGEGGDVFTFVQKHEHLDFPETLKLLADRAGVMLPERSPGQHREDSRAKELRDRLYRVNSFAAKYYHQILLGAAGSKALTYLTGRSLTAETIASWSIGYAPDDYQLLERVLKSKGALADDLVAAGVSARSSRGTYDRFRGRVTFPIFDFSGRIVGFSARILGSEQVAKYINSPESPIYTKGQVLFGLYQAKNAIRDQDYAVIVEGQMDCIKAHQAGFINTVATSGTALTEQQLRLLARLTRNLKMCFDADAAGQSAAKKAGVLALSLGFSVKLVHTQGAKDPDELISSGKHLWEAALGESVWFVEKYIQDAERLFPARSVEQRKFVTQEVIPLLRLVGDKLEQDHYLQMLTERLGFSKTTLQEQLSHIKPIQSAAPRTASLETEVVDEVIPTIEKNVLGIFLSRPEFLQQWVSEGGRAEDFSALKVRSLVAGLVSGTVPEVHANTLAQEALFVVESEKTNADGDEAAFLLELQKTMYAFRLAALKNRQQQVTANIRQAELGKNPELLRSLQREFAELATMRLALERKIASP